MQHCVPASLTMKCKWIAIKVQANKSLKKATQIKKLSENKNKKSSTLNNYNGKLKQNI